MEWVKKLLTWLPLILGTVGGLGTISIVGWFDPVTNKPNWAVIWPGLFMAVIGAITKFRNATGGTVGITPEGQSRTGEPVTITPTADAPPPIIPAINAETNSLAVKVIDVASKLASGQPAAPSDAAALRAVSDRLFAIGADPSNPIPQPSVR